MKKYKAVQVEIQEVDTVVCNLCGRTISEHGGNHDCHVSVEKKWGYGTKWDGETHSFDLCETCYEELISRFKIDIARSGIFLL
ncbi:MAG: hypothetical protein LBU32_03315 [Clostridiales bacterium]|nr:hypothetical protein [Clostridiales bacterium]